MKQDSNDTFTKNQVELTMWWCSEWPELFAETAAVTESRSGGGGGRSSSTHHHYNISSILVHNTHLLPLSTVKSAGLSIIYSAELSDGCTNLILENIDISIWTELVNYVDMYRLKLQIS